MLSVKGMVVLAVVGFAVYMSPLQAILDGQNAAIQLDTHYSFTNFEFARGFVRLNQGFDVPTNGTVVLSVNQYINHAINLRGGTIIMNDDLYLGPDAKITGSGYIKSNNFTIYFLNSLRILSTITFINGLKFNGQRGGILKVQPPGQFNLSKGVGGIGLEKMKFFVEDPLNTILLPKIFSVLYLDDVDFEVFSLGTMNFPVPEFEIKNYCSLTGFGSTFKTTGTLHLVGDAKLEVNEQVILKVPTIRTDNNDTQLRLHNNSELFITTSQSLWSGFGAIKVSGKATLKSENSFVTTWNKADLIFDSSSRLILDNTYFKLR